jgi:hypothetical protein
MMLIKKLVTIKIKQKVHKRGKKILTEKYFFSPKF